MLHYYRERTDLLPYTRVQQCIGTCTVCGSLCMTASALGISLCAQLYTMLVYSMCIPVLLATTNSSDQPPAAN